MADLCTRCILDIRQWNGVVGSRPTTLLSYVDGITLQDASGAISNTLQTQRGASIIFAHANIIRDCPKCKPRLATLFEIPEFWWSEYCKYSNGNFGHEEVLTDGEPDGSITWCRFLIKHMSDQGKSIQYSWSRFNVFTRFYPKTQHTVVFIFEPSPGSEEGFVSYLSGMGAQCDIDDPFWVYRQLLNFVVTVYDTTVWGTRDIVRAIEKQRPLAHPNPDYHKLHEVARHAVHASEMLHVATNTVDTMLKQYEQYRAAQKEQDGAAELLKRRNTASRLSFYHNMLVSLRHRSDSNLARLRNEMDLAFHSVTQYDSHLSVKIAEATKIDSAAMKIIAFVTLLFLPATFVSAIFSTSFFNWDRATDTWAVSGQFWIYWAVSTPLTAGAILLWFYWQRFAPPI